MMINVKDFYDLSYDYWKNKLGLFGCYWYNGSYCGSLSWNVNGAVGHASRHIGARLDGNKWKVYNGFYHDESVNIIMTENNIEFIEDSDFTDISRDEMYDFYLFLKEQLYLKELYSNKTNENTDLIPINQISNELERLYKMEKEYKELREKLKNFIN